MRIRFTKPYEVKAVNGPAYAKDDEVDLTEASARHFVSRGVAEIVEGSSAPAVQSNASDTSGYPEGFPSASKLIEAGHPTFQGLKALLTEESDPVSFLTAIDGIGKSTAEKVVAAILE